MPIDRNDPEVKELISEIEDGLKAKIDSLLTETKKLKSDLRAKDGVDADEFARVEAENERLKAEVATTAKELKTVKAEAEQATKALESESGFTRQLLGENGLREALVSNGVTNAAHQKAVIAMLSGSIEIASDGASRVAKIGDKALGDYVKEWASSDEGKHFVSAPINGGGGATPPGNAPNGAKTVDRNGFDAMNPIERAGFVKEGGKVVDA